MIEAARKLTGVVFPAARGGSGETYLFRPAGLGGSGAAGEVF